MTEGRHRTEDAAAERLRHDRRAEQRLFWKGVLALLVVVLLVLIRQRYLV